jgi:hypothetical protein
MSIVNKRNAVVGWVVLKLGKRAAKKKASGAVPDARTSGIAAGALAGLAGIAGALLFWRKKRGSDE